MACYLFGSTRINEQKTLVCAASHWNQPHGFLLEPRSARTRHPRRSPLCQVDHRGASIPLTSIAARSPRAIAVYEYNGEAKEKSAAAAPRAASAPLARCASRRRSRSRATHAGVCGDRECAAQREHVARRAFRSEPTSSEEYRPQARIALGDSSRASVTPKRTHSLEFRVAPAAHSRVYESTLHADDRRLADQSCVLEKHSGTPPTGRELDMEPALKLSKSSGNDVPTANAQSRLAAYASDRLSDCVAGAIVSDCVAGSLQTRTSQRRLSLRFNTGILYTVGKI